LDSLRILLIDDEKIIRDTLRELLLMVGHKIDTASNGIEGLEKLQQQTYNVVFVDNKMPAMDGMTFLRQALKKWPELPVIMITGHGSDEIKDEAVKSGAFAFVNKPFYLRDIQIMLKQLPAS
jgi:DNA-binding NtrC family response regulator